jgi:hypothetical protein
LPGWRYGGKNSEENQNLKIKMQNYNENFPKGNPKYKSVILERSDKRACFLAALENRISALLVILERAKRAIESN